MKVFGFEFDIDLIWAIDAVLTFTRREGEEAAVIGRFREGKMEYHQHLHGTEEFVNYHEEIRDWAIEFKEIGVVIHTHPKCVSFPTELGFPEGAPMPSIGDMFLGSVKIAGLAAPDCKLMTFWIWKRLLEYWKPALERREIGEPNVDMKAENYGMAITYTWLATHEERIGTRQLWLGERELLKKDFLFEFEPVPVIGVRVRV